jgi:hypothetical protein
MWDAQAGVWVDDSDAIFEHEALSILASLEVKRSSLEKRLSLALLVDGVLEPTKKAELVQEWSDACTAYDAALMALIGG